MLLAAPTGAQVIESNVGGTTAAELGTLITAAGSSHTKGAFSSGELIASTARASYGITVMLAEVGTAASTNSRMLVDIGLGASGSETVLIPDLLAGNVGTLTGAVNTAAMYHFPLFIPSASRLSARCQALIASDTVRVAVWLHQHVRNVGWVGQRVTAYGPDTATSSGVSVPQSTGAYGTTTEITSSCTYPIRAMQLGVDLATDTTGVNKRGIVRVGTGATPEWIASDLPFGESTSTENISCMWANLILQGMRFSIPAATRLALATRTSAAENRGWAIYAVG